ncbi:acetyl-CoA hydrolase/transferase family protein [Chloroflexota bacterium]
MSWQDKYKDKLISVEQAAKVVKSGDMVSFAFRDYPRDILFALAERKDELRGVTIQSVSTEPYPWLQPGIEDSFKVVDYFPIRGFSRDGVWERRIDWAPWIGGLGAEPNRYKAEPSRGKEFLYADVYMLKLTPPNEQGYCSFGCTLFYNPSAVRTAKIVIAEIDPKMIWTYGDYVHVSELDHLVEITPQDFDPYSVSLPLPPADEAEKAAVIGANIASLVRDGDTIEVGTGTASEAVHEFLGSKNDLGLDTEVIYSKTLNLIKSGVITGKNKNVDRGKHRGTCIAVYPWDEDMQGCLAFADHNPTLEMWGSERQLNLARLANVENLVAINNAVSIDLLGQAVIDHLGVLPFSGVGGQLEFAIGAHYGKGSRSITALMSTAKEGAASRIVPQHEFGSVIQLPMVYIDYLITEHGIVNLECKSRRERAEAIISVAAPKFREELMTAAKKLFYP